MGLWGGRDEGSESLCKELMEGKQTKTKRLVLKLGMHSIFRTSKLQFYTQQLKKAWPAVANGLLAHLELLVPHGCRGPALPLYQLLFQIASKALSYPDIKHRKQSYWGQMKGSYKFKTEKDRVVQFYSLLVQRIGL